MCQWDKILTELIARKGEADRAYKCINKSVPIRRETIIKHCIAILAALNGIAEILRNLPVEIATVHKEQGQEIFISVRDKLIAALGKHNIEAEVPSTYTEDIQIEFEELYLKNEDDSQLEKEEYTENLLSGYHSVEKHQFKQNPIETKMPVTAVEFIKLASSILPEFDGSVENLTRFLDAIDILEQIKETHEATAVLIVKTKLKGTARNLINNEQTLQQIKDRLKTKVKGESVEVLIAKIMNIQQRNKTANQYTSEIETLTKSLEGAYISDGLTSELATKYATQTAVKAMCKNCSMDSVKLIMQAGTFTTMNDAISKFTNSCTDASGNPNTILYINQNRGSYHGNYRQSNNRGRFRPNYSRDDYSSNKTKRNFNQNGQRFRGQHNQRNIRNITQQENQQTPLQEQE